MRIYYSDVLADWSAAFTDLLILYLETEPNREQLEAFICDQLGLLPPAQSSEDSASDTQPMP